MAENKSDALSPDVAKSVQEWLEWDPNSKSRAEVQQLKEQHKNKELTALFHPRIAFGTAGLRSRMAPGYACMNDLVILQTTQGFAKYILEKNPDAKQQGVIIGYDGRHNSKSFAELTAAVFLSQGIPVYLFTRLVCTPFVPYGVLEYKCAAGVMVTASHNPKDDNGYKVYWSNGAQIIPPHDSGIAASILANLKPWQSYKLDTKHALLKDPTATIMESYYREISKRYCWAREDNKQAKLRITYTAMHGVGADLAALALKCFDLPPYIDVKEQNTPDPEFPTVKFPNPEEGKGALALAIKTAEKEGSHIIVANDPDADRMAAAERDVKSGEWCIFNGNEIALLLADYVWTNWQRQNANGDKSKCVMIASTVSSQAIKAMAAKEGFQFRGTLTGFKWMGNVAHDVIHQGLTFLFAFEVEIGFLVGDLSLDKDGVRTAAIFYEMANQWALKGVTLTQRLDQLYKKYGYFTMNTSYFFVDQIPEKMVKIFTRLRTMNKGGYPDTCGKFKISSVRDVTIGYDSSEKNGVCALPKTPDAQMITFRFENGAVCTMRGSGTEPKLKYYVESFAETSAQSRALTDEMTAQIISEFMQPDLNGLVAAKK